ncbi:MAG: hypothetical protein EKK33_02140 [Bradyrhizobiaceae bacterium]|nr:MAG: hypothetical protein EKK33_02140 [Bradyrhizobiaceae bacterium]
MNDSQEPTLEFSKIAEATAMMNDAEAALEIYQWFGSILERYHLPEGFSGKYTEADFDFFRFVGHELAVTLFACLLRERRYARIAELLQEPLPVRYHRRAGGPGNREWSDLSAHVSGLGGASQQRRRISVHADILHERHSTGSLASVVPEDDFLAADFFLFLRGELPPAEDGPHFGWRAWSALYLKGVPRFLLDAERKTRAEELARALSVPTVEELKRRLEKRGPELRRLFNSGFWDYPIGESDVRRIGTR